MSMNDYLPSIARVHGASAMLPVLLSSIDVLWAGRTLFTLLHQSFIITFHRVLIPE